MIKFGFTKDPDIYKFDNKKRIEIILFSKGIIISITRSKEEDIEIYNPKEDIVFTAKGLKRISNFYKIKSSYPWIYKDSILRANIPLHLS